MDIAVGDWIRFLQGGRVVLGIVQYLHEADRYPYGPVAVTDIGIVSLKDVFECRKGV